MGAAITGMTGIPRGVPFCRFSAFLSDSANGTLTEEIGFGRGAGVLMGCAPLRGTSCAVGFISRTNSPVSAGATGFGRLVALGTGKTATCMGTSGKGILYFNDRCSFCTYHGLAMGTMGDAGIGTSMSMVSAPILSNSNGMCLINSFTLPRKTAVGGFNFMVSKGTSATATAGLALTSISRTGRVFGLATSGCAGCNRGKGRFAVDFGTGTNCPSTGCITCTVCASTGKGRYCTCSGMVTGTTVTWGKK